MHELIPLKNVYNMIFFIVKRQLQINVCHYNTPANNCYYLNQTLYRPIYLCNNLGVQNIPIYICIIFRRERYASKL